MNYHECVIKLYNKNHFFISENNIFHVFTAEHYNGWYFVNYIIQRQDSKTNVSNNPRTSPRPKWLAISGSWILYNYHIWFICIMFYSNLCETLNQLLITYGDMICSDRWPPSLTGLTPYHGGWLFCQRSPGRQSSQDRVWLDQNQIWILNLDPATVWW